MSGTFGELVVVLVIVAAMVVLGIRTVYRLLAGRDPGKCCACSSCTCRDTTGKQNEESI
jgi:hypothetical protein